MPRNIEDEPSFLAFSRVMVREGQSVPASTVSALLPSYDYLWARVQELEARLAPAVVSALLM